MPRTLLLAACLATLLAGCSDPATGHCTGTLAGAPFDADIDPESEHHVVQRQVCTVSGNQTRWTFSFGEGALQISALSPEASPSSLVELTADLPPEGTWFEQWMMLAPRDSAALQYGTMTIPADFPDFTGRIKGSFQMGLADGTALTCTFDLPKANDEGRDIDCPDEHTSSHHHDWDD